MRTSIKDLVYTLQRFFEDEQNTVENFIEIINQTPNPKRVILNTLETSLILGFSPGHVRHLLRKRDIKGFKYRKYWRIPICKIVDYLNNHRLKNKFSNINSQSNEK